MLRWMVATLAFGFATAVGALAIERALRLARASTRGAWVVAILVALTWPVVAVVWLTRPLADATVLAGPAIAGALLDPANPAPPSLIEWIGAHGTLVVSSLWALLSAVLTVQLVRAVVQLREVERDALRTDILGEPVLLAERLGPAVFGVWRPRVVVPRWFLELDESLQSLVLRHEREHCLGGDPWLVWLAVVSTTLMPWNLALWLMAYRLRLAMEVDCDARTLRAFPDRRAAYARLLLFIAQRATTVRITPALAHIPTHLSGRIEAMSPRPARRPLLQRLAAVAVAGAAVAAACSRPVAGNLAGPAPTPVARPAAAPDAPASPAAAPAAPAAPPAAPAAPAPAARPYFDFQTEKPATVRAGSQGPRYPDALRANGIEGVVLTQFVVNADGRVDMATLKVLKSDREEFTTAVRDALTAMEFEPARVKGAAVRQLMQQPFQFSLGGRSAPSAATPASQASTEPRSNAAPASAPASALDHGATALPTVKGPRYPETLRDQKVEGSVLVQLVVNADGTPEMASLKVVRTDHALFADAVRTALTDWRWDPATVQGRAVRQLVTLPFDFSLSR